MAYSPTMIKHGGSCCGVKTLLSFWHSPNFVLPAVTVAKRNNQEYFYNSKAYDDRGLPNPKAEWHPSQTAKERVIRLIDYLKKNQKAGMIEAVLASVDLHDKDPNGRILKQDEEWGPVLEELGFVKTLSWHNSNSSNKCHHYALIYDSRPAPKKQTVSLRRLGTQGEVR